MMRYFGLILVVSSWIGGFYLVHRWYNKDLDTISKHAASNKTATSVFATIVIGYGLIFYYWLRHWFAPHLELNSYFQAILLFTVICQILVGLAPDKAGWSRRIHSLAAYTMAVMYLPLSLLIIDSHRLSMLARLICILSTIYMLVTFSLVAVAGKAKNKYLFFQASYLVAFQLLILSAAYL